MATFRKEVREKFHGSIKGPFNEEDRQRAGLGKEFYGDLRGEGFGVQGVTDVAANVAVAYDP